MVVILRRLILFIFFYSSAGDLQPIVLHNNTYHNATYLSVHKDVEYILLYENENYYSPLRVTIDADSAEPVMVVVRKGKTMLSWQVPLAMDDPNDVFYTTTARTLCEDNFQNFTLTKFYNSLFYADVHGQFGVQLKESPIISISTESETNVSVNVSVKEETDFYVKPNTTYNIEISPSQPKYYFYEFTENSTKTNNFKTVILEVNSSDEICMTVSIQNASCPIFDLNRDITYKGYYETVSNRGGITISKEKFPYGFFIVFVAKGTDYDCTGDDGNATVELTENVDRTKHLTFIVKPSITMDDYVNAMLIAFFGLILFIVVFAITYLLCLRSTFKPRTTRFVEAECVTSVETPDDIHDNVTTVASDDFLANISMDETEYDAMAEACTEPDIYLVKPNIYLSDLARKDPRILIRKSNSYLWHVLTVALFYGLPSIQLVITYQKVLNDTGNQDLCYYNFLCAHPLGFFSDFNHIYSNIGYVMFGFVFLWIVVRREKWHEDIDFDKNYGIPQHYGLFYALGVSLIMEGILSASYHICPNHNNFQFDTSFMYIIAVLCIVKLYQTRHPDINATAYATFGVLSIAILLGMIGILESNIYFWLTFTVLHVLTCLYLSLQIYYMGRFKLIDIYPNGFRTCMNDCRSSFLNAIKPTHKARLFILVIFNAVNVGLMVFSFKFDLKNFPIYLFGVFMINTVLYFIVYLVMKLLHKERLNLLTLIFLAISTICAVLSMHFFLKKGISWEVYPAQSRKFNRECTLLHFYDNHDVWHFLSAIGMFFMFMVLLTMDDDLAHTPRTKIHVF